MDDSLLGAELEDDEATAVMEDPNDPAGTPEEVSVGSEAEENAAEASSDDEAPQSPDAASEDAASEDSEEEAARWLAGDREARRPPELLTRDVVSNVKFKVLSKEAIDAYIACGDWRGKAGGYGIQGPASAFIPWFSGSYSAIVGLPLAETYNVLTALGCRANWSTT